MVETLKPCNMLTNLFELIALKANGNGKTLGVSAWAEGLTLALTASARAHVSPGETSTT